jgi:hypothetical protein
MTPHVVVAGGGGQSAAQFAPVVSVVFWHEPLVLFVGLQ